MPRPVVSDQDYGGVSRITGLPAAVAAGQPVTYEQMGGAIEGIAWKDEVRVRAPADVNLAAPGANIDGVAMANGQSFLAPAQDVASENGIYIFNGAATPATRRADATTFEELTGAIVTVVEGTSAGATFRQTQVGGVIDDDDILWTNFGDSVPPASEATAGKIEIATQAEVDAGADDSRAVTPAKLEAWDGRILIASGNLGDAAATAFNIDHNWNTRRIQATVFKNSGNFDDVIADVTRPTVNRITITFSVAPALNAYSYLLFGRP